MPRKPPAVLPSLDNSFGGTISTSRKSEKSAVSVRDLDYRQSLRYRNIYIEREKPPPELVRRAQRLTSRSRTSPDLDDAVVKEPKDASRELQNETEEELVQQLAPGNTPEWAEASPAITHLLQLDRGRDPNSVNILFLANPVCQGGDSEVVGFTEYGGIYGHIKSTSTSPEDWGK